MCGIVGVFTKGLAVQLTYDGLQMLQHRGQDASGMASCDNRTFYLHKNNGLLSEVFNEDNLMKLKGNMCIGHVRYPTAGCSSSTEAQPFYVNSPYGIVLAHNGNLTNTKEIQKQLYYNNLRHINTSSDSEVLLNVFAHALSERNSVSAAKDDIFYAVEQVHKICKGGYAVVALIAGVGMVAFRDPNGIRPLCFGTVGIGKEKSYMVASESVAFDITGFTRVGDILPGEVLFIDKKGNSFRKKCAGDKPIRPCLFEYVYLSRPDSVLDDIPVDQSRTNMGFALANKIKKQWKNYKDDIDVIIPIPETSRTTSIEMARLLDIPLREGFVKNRYVGRTFIMPSQENRSESVRRKLNAIPSEFKGKKVLLVDDSIVRGTTSRKIIELVRELGAKKVYIASAAPEIRYPNVYGIDMPCKEDLIAYNKDNDEICKILACDKLIYQDLEDLKKAVSDINPNITEYDDSVFSGNYITGDLNDEYFNDLRILRDDSNQNNKEITSLIQNIVVDSKQ